MAIRLPDEEQRRNLRKLAEYLLSGDLRAEFDMTLYGNECRSPLAKECGSVGCAVGHGPYAGISKHDDEEWPEYAGRVFGAHRGHLFGYLFGAGWRYYDNTPEGAGQRIRGVLEQIENGTLTEDYLVERTPFVGDLSSAVRWL